MSRKRPIRVNGIRLYPEEKTRRAQRGGDGAMLPFTAPQWQEARERSTAGLCPAPSCGRALVPEEGFEDTWSVGVEIPAWRRQPAVNLTILVCSRDCCRAWIKMDQERRGPGRFRTMEFHPPASKSAS